MKTYTHQYSVLLSNGVTSTGRASSAELAMKAGKACSPAKPRKWAAYRVGPVIVTPISK